jgi:hypothetical protein
LVGLEAVRARLKQEASELPPKGSKPAPAAHLPKLVPLSPTSAAALALKSACADHGQGLVGLRVKRPAAVGSLLGGTRSAVKPLWGREGCAVGTHFELCYAFTVGPVASAATCSHERRRRAATHGSVPSAATPADTLASSLGSECSGSKVSSERDGSIAHWLPVGEALAALETSNAADASLALVLATLRSLLSQ